jgi:hypothetical protein
MTGSVSPVLSETDLASIVEAGNLVVASNWVGTEMFGYPVGSRIHAAAEVLQLPHRLTVLTRPYVEQEARGDNTQPVYYYAESVFSDPTASPTTPFSEFEETQRKLVMLIGARSPRTEAMIQLAEYFGAMQGLYTYQDHRMGLTVQPDEHVLLHRQFTFPAHVEPTAQKTFHLEAGTQRFMGTRLIPIRPDTAAIAAQIIELNKTRTRAEETFLF